MTREDIDFDFDNELIQKTKDKGETIDIFNEQHGEREIYGDTSIQERANWIIDWSVQELYEKAREYYHRINKGIENNDFCDLFSIFESWQYMYYEELARNALQAVENYINE